MPRSLDQPHAATLGIDFRASARSSLAVAWRYRSGWPTTPVRSVLLPDPDDPDELENQLVFGRLNSERLGVYHRLDLRASHRVPLSRGSLLLFLDVQNVYDRANDAGFDVTIDDETGEIIARGGAVARDLPVAGSGVGVLKGSSPPAAIYAVPPAC